MQKTACLIINIIIIRCIFSFVYIGRKPTTCPANNCLRISVLLQIMFCSYAIETTLWCENGRSHPYRSPERPLTIFCFIFFLFFTFQFFSCSFYHFWFLFFTFVVFSFSICQFCFFVFFFFLFIFTNFGFCFELFVYCFSFVYFSIF